jgi:hypothetical protein
VSVPETLSEVNARVGTQSHIKKKFKGIQKGISGAHVVNDVPYNKVNSNTDPATNCDYSHNNSLHTFQIFWLFSLPRSGLRLQM